MSNIILRSPQVCKERVNQALADYNAAVRQYELSVSLERYMSVAFNHGFVNITREGDRVIFERGFKDKISVPVDGVPSVLIPQDTE